MKISTILFDLDGTLLPLDQEVFTNSSFKLLTDKLADKGYEPSSIWAGTKAMMQNNGEKTNEQIFFETLSQIYGEKIYDDKKYFDDFYENHFDQLRSVCGYNKEVSNIIKTLKQNFKISIATSPLFPQLAIEKRIKWAGLDPSDFDLITTYENSHFCKPNEQYYLEIIKNLNVDPKECLMVGNDATEDMCAKNIGMKVFLITDCLVNRKNIDISQFPNGNYQDLLNYIKKLN